MFEIIAYVLIGSIIGMLIYERLFADYMFYKDKCKELEKENDEKDFEISDLQERILELIEEVRVLELIEKV